MRGLRETPAQALEDRLVPLLASAVRGGEDLSASALVRGLGGPTRRTNLVEARLRPLDWACLVGAAVVAALAVATPLLCY